MAHNRRTVSKIEFNKRIRDLVSRDSNRLRQTFQKFDKECASRLAEIQSMQEKVRHSMRNLTQDKMQAQLSTEHDPHLARRESETERAKSVPHQGSVADRKALNPEERRKSNDKASLPGISYSPRSDHLDVPSSGQSRSRRHSLPHRPTFLPGSPKENRTLPRASVATSLPKQAFVKPASSSEASPVSSLSSSPKDSSHGLHLQHRKNGYRLSIRDLPISSPRSDNGSHIRVKRSPQLERRGHTRDSNENCDKGDEGVTNSKNPRERSHTPSKLNITMETEPRRGSDPNNVKSKPLVKRTRSSSLPIEPNTLFKADLKSRDQSHPSLSRTVKSASHEAGGKRGSPPAIPTSALPNKESEPAARPFEELRRCRYLRSDDTEA